MKVSVKCNQCGKCCKNSWPIHLNIKDIKVLEKLGYKIKDFVEIKSPLPTIKQTKDGCIFLQKNNLCLIHEKHGFNKKPAVCREFPYDCLVCGEIIKVRINKKKKWESCKKDYFLKIGDNKIYIKTFAKMLKSIKIKKSLFEEYCNLLINIMQYKEEIIIRPFKLKETQPKISWRLKLKLYKILFKSTNTPSLNWIRLLIKKELKIELPTKKIGIEQEKTKFRKEEKKELIKEIVNSIPLKETDNDLPIKILFNLYFIPDFVKNKNSKERIFESYTLLNSLDRFGNLNKYSLQEFTLIEKNIKKLLK